MATTIQQIELPKKARAVDTSSGWQTVGSNLITNGTFTSNITGWSNNITSTTPTVAYSSGKARVTNASGANHNTGLNTTNDPFEGLSGMVRVTGNISIISGSVGTWVASERYGSVTSFVLDGDGNFEVDISLDVGTTHDLAIYTYTGNVVFDVDNITATKLENFSNNNHGQIYSGRALEFDGVTDYLDAADTLIDPNPTDTGHTWSLWFKTSSAANPSATQYLMDKYYNTDRIQLYMQTDGTLVFYIRSENHSGTDDYDGTCTTSVSLATSSWYHVVATIDKNDTAGLKLYINGVLSVTGGDSVSSTIFDTWTGGRTLKIGAVRTGDGNFFDGAICNVQVWNKEFTAADAEYAFLNPESLALNNSGTALTESNLKLWYPMQDGHRGQQSYILDGANTGAVSEKIVDGSFANDLDDWTVYSTTSATGGVATIGASSNSGIYQNILTEGERYTATVNVTSYDGVGTAQFANSNGNNIYTITETGIQTFTFTHSIAAASLILRGMSNALFSVSSVSVKQINDKNHATTVFYGDELVTNGTFDTNITGWDSLGGWAFDSSQKAIHASGVSSDYLTKSGVLVIGRTYKYEVTTSGGFDSSNFIQIYSGGAHALHADEAAQSGTFVATSTDFRIRGVSASADIFIDNVSCKEVGVASGWTDADQQLHIPQTALQSYNELAWFNGTGDAIVSTLAANLGTNDFVISYVIRPEDFSGSPRLLGFQHSANTGRVIHYLASNGQLQLYIQDGSSPTVAVGFVAASSIGAIQAGKTYHIVEVFDRTADLVTIYINGAASGSTIDISTLSGVINCNGNLGFYNYSDDYWTGLITEVALWKNTDFDSTEVLELYNDGKPLDALLHTKTSTLYGYWRNNGLSTWVNLANPGTKDTSSNTLTETILIPQGVDSTRDNQGFIMNKEKDTSCLNLTNGYDDPYVDLGSEIELAVGDAGSFMVWLKPEHITNNYFMGSDAGNESARIASSTSVVTRTVGSNLTFDVGSGDIVVGEWFHFAASKDTDNVWSIYIDGVQNGSASADTEDNDKAFAYQFLGARRNTSNSFNGQFDGALIYGSALSQLEIEKNYKATKGNHRN